MEVNSFAVQNTNGQKKKGFRRIGTKQGHLLRNLGDCVWNSYLGVQKASEDTDVYVFFSLGCWHVGTSLLNTSSSQTALLRFYGQQIGNYLCLNLLSHIYFKTSHLHQQPLDLGLQILHRCYGGCGRDSMVVSFLLELRKVGSIRCLAIQKISFAF